MDAANTVKHLLKRYPSCRQYNMIWARRREPPFKVLIGTIISQRSRDETTEKVARALFGKYNTAEKIARLPLRALEEIVKPSGPYHQKAHNIKKTCEALAEKFDGKVPRDAESLLSLPGVGQKTADCVLLYGFGKDVIPVDTHVHKLANLLGWVRTKKPEQTKVELEKIFSGKERKVVNCVLVSLGQETRYNPKKLEEAIGKAVPDVARKHKKFQLRRKRKDFDR